MKLESKRMKQRVGQMKCWHKDISFRMMGHGEWELRSIKILRENFFPKLFMLS